MSSSQQPTPPDKHTPTHLPPTLKPPSTNLTRRPSSLSPSTGSRTANGPPSVNDELAIPPQDVNVNGEDPIPTGCSNPQHAAAGNPQGKTRTTASPDEPKCPKAMTEDSGVNDLTTPSVLLHFTMPSDQDRPAKQSYAQAASRSPSPPTQANAPVNTTSRTPSNPASSNPAPRTVARNDTSQTTSTQRRNSSLQTSTPARPATTKPKPRQSTAQSGGRPSANDASTRPATPYPNTRAARSATTAPRPSQPQESGIPPQPHASSTSHPPLPTNTNTAVTNSSAEQYAAKHSLTTGAKKARELEARAEREKEARKKEEARAAKAEREAIEKAEKAAAAKENTKRAAANKAAKDQKREEGRLIRLKIIEETKEQMAAEEAAAERAAANATNAEDDGASIDAPPYPQSPPARRGTPQPRTEERDPSPQSPPNGAKSKGKQRATSQPVQEPKKRGKGKRRQRDPSPLLERSPTPPPSHHDAAIEEQVEDNSSDLFEPYDPAFFEEAEEGVGTSSGLRQINYIRRRRSPYAFVYDNDNEEYPFQDPVERGPSHTPPSRKRTRIDQSPDEDRPVTRQRTRAPNLDDPEPEADAPDQSNDNDAPSSKSRGRKRNRSKNRDASLRPRHRQRRHSPSPELPNLDTDRDNSPAPSPGTSITPNVPIVQGRRYYPQGLTDWHNVSNLDRAYMQSFAKFCLTNPGISAAIFDGRAPTQATASADAGRIQRAIESFLQRKDIRVSPPKPQDTSAEALSDGPFNFLVSGITQSERERLLATATIYHDTDAIHTSAVGLADPEIQTYLVSFTGFATEDVAEVERTVRELFVADNELKSIFDDMTPETHDPLETFRFFLDSIWGVRWETRSGGGGTRTTFNIHARIPSNNPTHRLAVTRRIRRLTPTNPLLGWVEVHPGYRCTRCHARDHPSGLCPFPLQAGWRGPPPIPSQPQTTQTQLALQSPSAQIIPDMPPDLGPTTQAPPQPTVTNRNRNRGRGGRPGRRGGAGGGRGGGPTNGDA
ncbi:uncharacterized protein STEHIDRAFT_161344 [Stereum hirsutum FP-91666 SS1]|uniref:uncharacterized protein n=1 Tax=Stereum hirsutum (strain FP-91666) TaxID=721885 RepID=UPI000444A4B0|nr:uncharacterized protein STEHIDRAFT_161344 [Stereum hirsutum FP-91666 SS1]EIM81991.1 hypothetical protein STEHIDRAFT_161344 [Stereum hirsutum FP-91666 SS1]